MNLTTLLKLASTRLDAERGGMSTSNLAYAEVDSEGNLVTVNPLAKMKWGWQKGTHVQGEMRIALEGLAGTQPTELPLKLGGLHIGAIVRGEDGGWQVFGYDPDNSKGSIASSPLRRQPDESPNEEIQLEQPRALTREETSDQHRIRSREVLPQTDAMDGQLKSGLQTLRLLATTSPDHAVFCDSAMQTIASTLGADRVLLFVRSGNGELSLASQNYSTSYPEIDGLVLSGNHPLLELVESHGSAMEINRSIAPVICSQLGCENGLVSSVQDNGLTVGYIFVIPTPDSFTDRTIGDMLRRPVDRLVNCFESLYSWITIISRYRNLVSTMEESVFSFHIDADGERYYSSFSDRIEQISGYRSSELSGSQSAPVSWIDQIVVDADQDSVRAKTRELASGHPIVNEYRIAHKNGSIRWVRERAWSRTDTAGLHSVQGTLLDISEQKAVEVMATDAQVNVDESRRSKTAFIATMSHEVRTPVGALTGYAQLLQKELVEFEQMSGTTLPDQVHEFMNVLTNRSHKLQVLVHDLFELSSLEMGNVSIQKEHIDINELIHACASKESPGLQRKGISLNLDLSEENPIVTSDAHCLGQVIKNVLSNATKFTERGSVSIRSRVESDTVIVEVEDTGVGISAEFQNSLFEPYSQEENWRTRKFGGTGLGLALSRRLLEKFGGKIEVESEKGKGSTFRILLPSQAE